MDENENLVEDDEVLIEPIPSKDNEVPKILLGPLIADRKKLGLSVPALLEKVKQAIAEGADVNDNSRNNHRPLQLAIRHGYRDIAACLIENGADVNFRDRSRLDPIHTAINNCQYKTANMLIKYGAKFSHNIPDLSYNYSRWYEFRCFYWGK